MTRYRRLPTVLRADGDSDPAISRELAWVVMFHTALIARASLQIKLPDKTSGFGKLLGQLRIALEIFRAVLGALSIHAVRYRRSNPRVANTLPATILIWCR